MRIDIAAQTDVGRKKRNNEDCYGVFREDFPGLRLFDQGAMMCVADGLGGHTGGEIASKLAVSIVRDALKQSCPEPVAPEPAPTPLPVLLDWIKKANTSIFQTNNDLVKVGRPMGTTLLVAVAVPQKAHVANVGDSRCYHIRDGGIIAKTEDHSWVDEQVKAGFMTKSEAESDARRNFVTRCIGTHEAVEVDAYTWDTLPGDMLLLCSDGLVNMVKDSEIAAEFKKGGRPADIASRLVNLANDNGGKDNITVIVALLEPSLFTWVRSRFLKMWERRGTHIAWMIFAILFGAACFGLGYLVGGNRLHF